MATLEQIEQTVREDLNFEVVKLPLQGPDNMKTPVYGIFRDDNMEYVGTKSVTDRYVPHKVADVAALISAAGPLFDNDFSIKCLWDTGHRVFIKPSRAQRREICKNDGIFPRLHITARYDGRAFCAQMGMYRDVCTNLAMLRTVESTQVTIRHCSSLPERMDELIEDFQSLANSFDNVVDACRAMEARKIKAAEFLHQILGDIPSDEGAKRTRYINTVDAINDRLQRERFRTGRLDMGQGYASGWELYNAVQGYAEHNKTRRGVKDTDKWVRTMKALDDTMVTKAETLALSM